MLPLAVSDIAVNNHSSIASSVKNKMAIQLADHAISSLLEEARLTPKPGLVDAINTGSHADMSLELFEKSAYSLWFTFYRIAKAGMEHPISQELRERIARIGREGEVNMYAATGGINTHKGAIWALGLITAVTSHIYSQRNMELQENKILEMVGRLASFTDEKYQKPAYASHGDMVKEKYQVKNALQLAQEGFPILTHFALHYYRQHEMWMTRVDLLRNVLIGIMALLDDSCILYRSDMLTLKQIQKHARIILLQGGVATKEGAMSYQKLDQFVMTHHVSPGGSADMLAATIFIQKIIKTKL